MLDFSHLISGTSVLLSLLAELADDTIVFRPLDGSPGYTASAMRTELAAGTAIGRTFASDLLRVSRDFLIRRSQSESVETRPPAPVPAETAMTVAELAEKTRRAMGAHNDSYVMGTSSANGACYSPGYHQLSLRDAFRAEFGDSPFGQLAYIAAFVAWNDTDAWCTEPCGVEQVFYSNAKWDPAEGVLRPEAQ